MTQVPAQALIRHRQVRAGALHHPVVAAGVVLRPAQVAQVRPLAGAVLPALRAPAQAPEAQVLPALQAGVAH